MYPLETGRVNHASPFLFEVCFSWVSSVFLLVFVRARDDHTHRSVLPPAPLGQLHAIENQNKINSVAMHCVPQNKHAETVPCISFSAFPVFLITLCIETTFQSALSVPSHTTRSTAALIFCRHM